MFTPITTIIVTVVMLFGGAGATVYAAQDSRPDDLLYTVKTWSEDFQLKLTKNPQAKFDLVEEIVLRRFLEIDTLLEEADPIPSGLVTRLENHLEYMLQLASHNADDKEMDTALLRIRSMLQDRVQLMTRQSENIPEGVAPVYAQIQQMLNERLHRIETGIEDPLKFKQQMDTHSGNKGPGTEAGNPDENSPTPTGKVDEKPTDLSPCDTAQEVCGGDGESGYEPPTESPMKGDEDLGHNKSNNSSDQDNNAGNGEGTKGSGKP